MSIWSITLAALTGLGKPLAANRYIPATGSQLPAEYIVFFLVDSIPAEAADDVETLRFHRMQVSYYSTTGLAGMPNIAGAMVAAGFTKSVITEIPYNADTGHYGCSNEFIFLEEE